MRDRDKVGKEHRLQCPPAPPLPIRPVAVGSGQSRNVPAPSRPNAANAATPPPRLVSSRPASSNAALRLPSTISADGRRRPLTTARAVDTGGPPMSTIGQLVIPKGRQ